MYVASRNSFTTSLILSHYKNCVARLLHLAILCYKRACSLVWDFMLLYGIIPIFSKATIIIHLTISLRARVFYEQMRLVDYRS